MSFSKESSEHLTNPSLFRLISSLESSAALALQRNLMISCGMLCLKENRWFAWSVVKYLSLGARKYQIMSMRMTLWPKNNINLDSDLEWWCFPLLRSWVERYSFISLVLIHQSFFVVSTPCIRVSLLYFSLRVCYATYLLHEVGCLPFVVVRAIVLHPTHTPPSVLPPSSLLSSQSRLRTVHGPNLSSKVYMISFDGPIFWFSNWPLPNIVKSWGFVFVYCFFFFNIFGGKMSLQCYWHAWWDPYRFGSSRDWYDLYFSSLPLSFSPNIQRIILLPSLQWIACLQWLRWQQSQM